MLGSRLPLLWWATIPRPRASAILSSPRSPCTLVSTFQVGGSRVNSRDSPKKKKKSLLPGYNPVGVFFWDELQEKLLIVTGLGLYNASQLYQVQGSAKCFGEAQGNYITIPFRRDILPTLLETGKLLSFSGTLFFFYGFFIIWLSVFYIRQPFCSGAPNDGFLLNALKTLFWLSRVLLDLLKCILRSRSCKVCICSVILGELESFRNFKGFSITFPKILDAIWSVLRNRVRIVMISLSITFLNPKILGFLFFSTTAES